MISYLACGSTTKENAKHVPCAALSLTVVFVNFFPLIEVRSILEKKIHFFSFFILSLVDFHAFDPLEKL